MQKFERKEVNIVEKIRANPNKFTHEQFLERLKSVHNNDIGVLDMYNGSGVKIGFKCNICGNIWHQTPNTILNGHGCPECGHKSRRMSKDDFLKALALVEPNLELISEYIKSSDQMTFLCKVCGTKSIKPGSNVLRGKGACKECYRRAKFRDPEDFKKEFDSIYNGDCVLNEPYVSSSDKISVHCNIHNVDWSMLPNNILKGKGCPKCSKERIVKAITLPEDIFLSRLKNAFDGKIILNQQYTKSKSPMQFTCLKCNHIWTQNGDEVLHLQDCPRCSGHYKTYDERISEIENNGNVIVLGEYVNAHTHLLVRCKTCGHEWMGNPNSLQQGHGCKLCGYKKTGEFQQKTHEQFVSQMSIINPDVIISGKYIAAQDHVECTCKLCGNIWNTTTATSLLSGSGCPKCTLSYGEKVISKWLKNNGIDYKSQKTFPDMKGAGGGFMKLDFYLPSYNIAIEYQGAQHYKPVDAFGGLEQLERQKKNDQLKRDYCKEHNIQLIEIPYWENTENYLSKYLNIESVETVISA